MVIFSGATAIKPLKLSVGRGRPPAAERQAVRRTVDGNED